MTNNYVHCALATDINVFKGGQGVEVDRYHVPEFPHSSATFNIISGFHILVSPKVLQGAFGEQHMSYAVQSTMPNASQ